MNDVNKRREILMFHSKFLCDCDACKMSEEDLAIQTKNPMMCTKMKDEVDCWKEMYKIAQEVKTMKTQAILINIVEEGFDASCQGFVNLSRISLKSKVEKDKFLQDANNFASVGDLGEQLSKMLYGQENSIAGE